MLKGILFFYLSLMVTLSARAETVVTKYEPFTQATVPDDVLELKETTAVLITPPVKEFADENSTEAQDYSTVMDDWAFYAMNQYDFFESVHVPVIKSDQHRFLITLADNRRIIFDTDRIQPQMDFSCGIFLYRKGHLPITLDFTMPDPDIVNKYLAQP
ncbi:hypothetical protein [Dryocola sp. BD626]|uniref:hypothetical protein n=1 Tax=Dryocola sp. BD626 TaxID=3133273 RepID=UPI003F4F45BA